MLLTEFTILCFRLSPSVSLLTCKTFRHALVEIEIEIETYFTEQHIYKYKYHVEPLLL